MEQQSIVVVVAAVVAFSPVPLSSVLLWLHVVLSTAAHVPVEPAAVVVAEAWQFAVEVLAAVVIVAVGQLQELVAAAMVVAVVQIVVATEMLVDSE